MKVTVKEKSSEKEYPWIGITDQKQIVLFNSETNGILLQSGINTEKVGFFSNDWHEYKFKKFEGEITLSNS